MPDSPYRAPSSLSAVEEPESPDERQLKQLNTVAAWMLALAICSTAVDLFFLIEEIMFDARKRTTMHLGIPELTLLLAFHGMQCWGALQMRKQRSYWLASAVAWSCCIPFLSPFVFCGIPFGIGAIRLLSKPQLQRAFRRVEL